MHGMEIWELFLIAIDISIDIDNVGKAVTEHGNQF
jgi:hypothetical protein